MQTPPQITFHGVEPSAFVEQRILAEIQKLERQSDRITSCRVVVEMPHQRHAKGNHYAVRLHLEIPGGHIDVKRSPDEHGAHEDPMVAVRDAFKEAHRQLRHHVDHRQQAPRQARERAPRGTILRVSPEEGFGFLRSEDGREVYFHENALIGGTLASLEVGAEVRYHEEDGDDGPQASTVHVR